MVEKYIITKCIDGNREAHSSLYNSCIPYVYSIVSRYLINNEDRKDVIQDTFVKVFKNINSFNEEKGKFKLWVRKIAVNESLMFIRRNKNLPMLSPIDELTELNLGEEDKYTNLSKKDIEIALADMPEGYKLVFMLNVIDGYNHGEISKMLGINKETSRSQLARAKKWMQKNLIENRKNIVYGLF